MSKSFNKVIKVLISSDIALQSGWGLLAPVFAIFILQRVTMDSGAEAAKIAGFASLVYWTVKSVLQIPIGRYLDKNHGEKDDFHFMVIGTFLTGLVPFGFIFASQSWHIYGLQVLQAVGMAMAVPSWSAIFTRHIDRGREAVEWGLRSTFLGFGVGVGGALGGIMAGIFGFTLIFIIVGVLTMLSVGLLFIIQKELISKDGVGWRFPPFRAPL